MDQFIKKRQEAGYMKKIWFFIFVFGASLSYADSSTIEGLIESYEHAREKNMLLEWRMENTHPNIDKNLSELQMQWKKITDCHLKEYEKKYREKDAKRPKHEKMEISSAKISTFNGMYVYPVEPEQSIQLYYPEGSFMKGTGFDVSYFDGRWYIVNPLYTDESIMDFLKTKKHFMYIQTPRCFELEE
jgi:hypothetical protein